MKKLADLTKEIKIAIGSDHAGFDRKEAIGKWLTKQKLFFLDVGVFSGAKKSDYPLYAQKVARLIEQKKVDYGFLFCASGTGMTIAANRFIKVRGLHCYANQPEIVSLARAHNDVNLLSFTSNFLSFKTTVLLIELFLKTNFSPLSRYQKRKLMLEKNS